MEWYERYKPQLAAIYEEACSGIAEFPPPLNEIGLRYATKFDPVSSGEGKDYICSLLPYWIQDAAGLSDRQCGQLALANVYGMFYFFIQDDVMDSKVADDWKEKLALGNLLYLGMFRIFRSLFPSDSTFWSHYERYAAEWADSVVNEGARNFYVHDPLRTAGKAAPVKITVVGAFLLAGTEERISPAEQAVDLALMTLQMLDDWFDWRQDLEDGSYNGLLAMIAAGTPTGGVIDGEVGPGAAGWQAPSKEQTESSIYVHGCMREFALIAERSHEELLVLPHGMPQLTGYHRYMANSLLRIADDLDANKRKLLGGGLNLLFG